MNLKNKKNPKLKYAIIGLLSVGLVAAAITVWYFNRSQQSASTQSDSSIEESKDKIDYSPAKESDVITDGSAKDQLAKPTPEGQDKSSSQGDLNLTITSASQQDQTILIRTLVDGATSGTCTLEATSPGQTTITKTAPVTTQASYALCQGFNIPVSDFSNSGTWSIQVTATYNGKSASSKTNIEVAKL